ncbi:hypothetical protein ONZ45_g3274 [Pleurotus djamor]|nr:hypothetical protein ONZ45_g3274 [Pleurotus djamor]
MVGPTSSLVLLQLLAALSVLSKPCRSPHPYDNVDASNVVTMNQDQVVLTGEETSDASFVPFAGEKLVLNAVERTITKVADQGNSAITYKVDSPPVIEAGIRAYHLPGKTSLLTLKPGDVSLGLDDSLNTSEHSPPLPNEASTDKFKDEIKWLTKVDELLAAGKYNNREWIVFHGVDDKKDLLMTKFGSELWQLMLKGSVKECEAKLTTKLPLIVAEAKAYVVKFGVLHTDIHPGNVLWDEAASEPTLIDWGRAEKVTGWTQQVEKRVVDQTYNTYLKSGETKICHDMKGVKPQDTEVAPFSETLTLGDVTRTITKVADQGDSAITYKVDGPGWPDPFTDINLVAYAKTGKSSSASFTEEIKWLSKVQELLAAGKYNGRNWIVFSGVEGKTEILYTDAIQDAWKKGQAACQAAVEARVPLIIAEVKTYVVRYGILHRDVHPGNVLWDKAATTPTLIDWGIATEEKSWAKVEKQVNQQVERMFLTGPTRPCQ